MNEKERPVDSTLGRSFPGPIARLFLKLAFPHQRREEFIGDLIEEAETVILPERGRQAALRWFWWQAAESIPPLLAQNLRHRIRTSGARWAVALAILTLGTLMAADSSLFAHDLLTIASVIIAIAVPAVTGLISGNLITRTISVLISMIMLISIRELTGVELRWYAMAWFFFILLGGWKFERHLFTTSGSADRSDSSPTGGA